MNSTGKLELVESEMQRYKINVMGLAETKWKGDAGHYFSDAWNMIINAQSTKKENGVGFIVEQASTRVVMG